VYLGLKPVRTGPCSFGGRAPPPDDDDKPRSCGENGTTAQHHPFPKFMGGPENGQLMYSLDGGVHSQFHSVLDATLRLFGFRGGRQPGAAAYYRNLRSNNPERYRASLNVLVSTAIAFDALCGTQIAPPTVTNLIMFVPGFGWGS